MKTIHLNLKLSTPLGKASLSGIIEVDTGPPMPGPIHVQVTKEENSMLLFKLVFPAPGAADVVSRELTTQIGEEAEVITSLPGTAMEAVGFKAADNAALKVSLVDVDDAGNRSEVREQTFTVVDTIAPPKPGELGVIVTGEE